VPGNQVVFVAPGRVDHYISKHRYLPPAEFIAAVWACPNPCSPEYRKVLRAANADVEPPAMGSG
jgi:hypothetical protein